MSAPAINAATPPSPGPAAGIGAGGPTDKGPLGVFEALLSAFSGVQAEPGAIALAAKTANGKAAAPGAVTAGGAAAAGDLATATPLADAEASDPKAADTQTADTQTADAAVQAACNAALVLPTAASPIAEAAVAAASGNTDEDAGQAATAWGRGKVPGQPAAPALANRAEHAEADDVVADLPAGEAVKAGPSPNASPRATAKLDLAVAPPLNTPEPPHPTLPPPAATPPGPVPAIPAEAAPAAVVDALVAPQAAPQAAAGAKAAEQPASAAPVAPKDKAQGAKAARNDHSHADTAPGPLAKSGAAVFAPISPVADGAPTSGADDHSALASATEAKPEADMPSGSADAGAATASTTNATTQIHPGAIPVRGSPQTVANLAAEIAKKLEGRSTRFDLELNPAGLGRVDVRMEIGATGRMTAAMTFDTPQAAAELRARAAELQRHLEQAGFDLSGGLSFDVAGDRGQGRQAQQQQDNDAGQAFRGRAFQEALATAGEAAQAAASGALNLRRSLLAGVDIRI